MTPTILPSKSPTILPSITPTIGPTMDTKCSLDKYRVRTFESNNTNGIGLYSETISDNYIIFTYNGNGDSFIRLCFTKDCQISGESSYINSFFEITLDEGGNTGIFSLKYIDTNASVTVLETITVPTLDLKEGNVKDFYVGFDRNRQGIMFGNSDQVGLNILLFNDLTECCDNYPSDRFGRRFEKPFRNFYYGSLGSLSNENIEITFCGEPIDLCPDFEFDYEKLVAWFRVDSFINDFETDFEKEFYTYWKDESYYGNHIESYQMTNLLNIKKKRVNVDGQFIDVISGDSSVVMNIDNPFNTHSMLPPLYTLITIARRDPNSPNAGNEGPIFEAIHNYTSGFGLNNEIGYASRNGIILTNGSRNDLILTDPGTLATVKVDSNSFILSSDKRSRYRVQGIDTTQKLPKSKKEYINFGINTNPLNGPSSSFEISEILIFNTELTLDEICCIEYYGAERIKIKSETGSSLYTSNTYPSCCIEVDEYPIIFNPTDTDIFTRSRSNTAKVSYLKELTQEIFEKNKSDNAFNYRLYVYNIYYIPIYILIYYL